MSFGTVGSDEVAIVIDHAGVLNEGDPLVLDVELFRRTDDGVLRFECRSFDEVRTVLIKLGAYDSHAERAAQALWSEFGRDVS